MASTHITLEDLSALVLKNEYIRNCSSNKNKDPSSLSSLIMRSLSQSDCIKLGTGIEKILQDIVVQKSSLTNIKQKNTKGKKERDHLFCDEKNKIIYYAELKANVNLDTEKSKSTYNKCLDIVNELRIDYPEYTINWCLLGYRYKHYDDIPPVIQKKYAPIKDNLFGINQYLAMLKIDFTFTDDTYTVFLNQIADEMFN
jgi:hypothetical protein